MASIRTSKSGPKAVPVQQQREFVLGSRPPDAYAQRIKPLEGQTQYGKAQGPAGSGPRQPNFNLTSGSTNRPGF